MCCNRLLSESRSVADQLKDHTGYEKDREELAGLAAP